MMAKERWMCLAVLLAISVYIFWISFLRSGSTVAGQIQQRSHVSDDVACYYQRNDRNSSLPIFNDLEEKRSLSSERNIFFLETSCGYRCDNKFHLNCRQACAVESAAQTNPNHLVHLLVFSSSPPSFGTNELFSILRSKYQNVNIKRVRLTDYIRGTPVGKWLTKDLLNSSKWPLIHLSDIMRLLTLWKFGGIYLDLDVVVMKSLEDMKNFAGAQDDETIANGIMGFDKTKFGHGLVNDCLMELMKDFRGDLWTHNGPEIITKILQKSCNVRSVRDMINSPSCKGFQVVDPSFFYPIPYEKWKRYFDEDRHGRILDLIKKSKIVHVWNKLSHAEPLREKSPYSAVARQFCPNVFERCKSTF